MQRERTINISNLPPPISIPTHMDMAANPNSFHISNHEETNFNRFFFTSRAIPQQSEGYYPFHLSAVLTEHETIRHEMVRCRAAIQCLNVHFMNSMSSTHSPLATYSATTDAVWQVLFLESWAVDYFLPALFIIENNRQKFLIPHYQQLGSDTSRVSHGMEELILQLTRIKEQIASSLNTLVFIVKTNARTNNDSSDYIPTTFLDEESTSEYTTAMILQQIREFSDGFDSLERILLPHYDRMEELWPEIIEDKGEIAWEDILNMMMTSNYATNSEQMTILTAATLTCLGCVLDESLRHSVLAHVLHAHYRNQHHHRQNSIHHSSSSSSQMTPTVTSTQTNSNKNMDTQYNPNHVGKSHNSDQMLVEDIENDPPNHNRSPHHHLNSSSGSQSNSLTNHSSSLLLSSHHRHSNSDDEHHHNHRGEENLLFSDTFDDSIVNNNPNNNNNNNNNSHNQQTNGNLFHTTRSNSSRNNNNTTTTSTSNHSGGRHSTISASNNVVKTGLNAAIASPSTSHSPPVSSYSSASSPMIVGNTSVSLSSVYLQQQAVPSNYHYQQHQHHHHHSKHQKIIKDETPEEVTERDRFTFMTRAYCNANTREEFMLHYPFAFSEFLLRTWDERYLRYQLLLFSISCGRDLVQALDDWRSGGGGGASDVLGWCNCCVS